MGVQLYHNRRASRSLYDHGFAALPAIPGVDLTATITGQLSKTAPDLAKGFTALAQAKLDTKLLSGQLTAQLPAGMQPEALLAQVGVSKQSIDKLLSNAGIPGGSDTLIAAGKEVLSLGSVIFSGKKVDAEEIAKGAAGLVHSVVSQIGGPITGAGSQITGIIGGALGMKTGLGTEVGGTIGSIAGGVLGPVGIAIGNAIGTFLGGGAEAAATALGLGSKAARLRHEKKLRAEDTASVKAFEKFYGSGPDKLFEQWSKGNVLLATSYKEGVAVIDGKAQVVKKTADIRRLRDNQPRTLGLASPEVSKGVLQKIQAYAKVAAQKQQDLTQKVSQNIRTETATRLKAHAQLQTALKAAIVKAQALKATGSAATSAPAQTPASTPVAQQSAVSNAVSASQAAAGAAPFPQYQPAAQPYAPPSQQLVYVDQTYAPQPQYQTQTYLPPQPPMLYMPAQAPYNAPVAQPQYVPLPPPAFYPAPPVYSPAPLYAQPGSAVARTVVSGPVYRKNVSARTPINATSQLRRR